MQYCNFSKTKTNCTEDCRICLKEEINEMKANHISETEINQFEYDWENQRNLYAM